MNQAKGHAEEAAAFVEALRSGSPMPIDLESLVATSQTTMLIQESLRSASAVEFVPPRAGSPSD